MAKASVTKATMASWADRRPDAWLDLGRARAL